PCRPARAARATSSGPLRCRAPAAAPPARARSVDLGQSAGPGPAARGRSSRRRCAGPRERALPLPPGPTPARAACSRPGTPSAAPPLVLRYNQSMAEGKGALASGLLARLGSPGRRIDESRIEAELQRLVAQARAEWPAIALDDATFVAH